jgi:hypothetical protein
MTDNDLQNITQKTKDRVTRIPLKTGLRQVFRKGGSSCSISSTGRVILVVLNMTSFAVVLNMLKIQKYITCCFVSIYPRL